MTGALADFLLARIDEDEAAARGVYSLSVYWRTTTGGHEFGPNLAYFEEPDDAVHVARWSPDRVLAECAAKRELVRLGQYWTDAMEFEGREILLPLTRPYAEHPDYRPEWREQ